MYKLGHPSVIQPSDWNPKLERAVNCNGAIGFRHESQHHYQPTPLLRQPTKKALSHFCQSFAYQSGHWKRVAAEHGMLGGGL